MKKKVEILFATDYVVLNRGENKMYSDHNGNAFIFGDKTEAEYDCCNGEEVVSCTELPQDLQELLLIQINKD